MDFPENLKLIVFDFDGTLHNLNVDWGRAMQVAEVEPDESLGAAIDRHKKTGRQEPIKNLDTLEADALKDQILKPDIAETLKRLSEKYKIAILSRNSSIPISELLKRSGIKPTLVVGRDEVSKQKPDPEGLQLILSKLGVDPDEALMVGDTWHDSQVASAVGVRSVILGSHDIKPKAWQNIAHIDELIEQLDS